jgi:hypothetical protein
MSPGDIVADRHSNHLYIIDWRPATEGGTRVWKVNPYTGSIVYLVNATHWTGTLSMTPRNEVLGVSGNGRYEKYFSLSTFHCNISSQY